MRTFCFQIQLDRLDVMTRDDVAMILDRLGSQWPEKMSSNWDDVEQYVNLMVESKDPSGTWQRAKWPMVDSKIPGGEIRNALIVTATGENGWDDYLLLHHYDNSEQIDALPEAAG